MDLQSYHETSRIARSRPDMTGTDAIATTQKSRTDSLKRGRKRLSSSVMFPEQQRYTRKRSAPCTSNEKATYATSQKSRATKAVATANISMQEANADSVRLVEKLGLRRLSPLEGSSNERSLRSNVSKLSTEIIHRLHLDENCGASLPSAKSKSQSNKPTDGKYLRPQTSQEVIPTTIGESNTMSSAGREISIPCQIRHASDTRIWMRKGRAVELKESVSQELFACELTTHSTGPSPFAFAYRINGSWYCVSAKTRERISVRKSDGDLSLLDGADSRAFFIEIDRKTSSGGVVIKSGAHEGCGITVKRNRLALSENPEEWFKWHISERPV